MPGPAPKDPAIRRRRNKTSTRATLARAPRARKRALPYRRNPAWHAQTKRTWNDWWASPQAAEWTEVHVSRLLILISLHEDFWRATTPKERKEAAAEIRLQEVEFGLTPLGERKLQWERLHEEAAQSKKPAEPPARPQAGDPRLTLVKSG